MDITEFQIKSVDVYSNKQSVDVDEIEVDDDLIIDYVREHHDPSMVFTESQLGDWAEDNGYIKE